MNRRRQRRPAGAAALRRIGIAAGLIAGAGGVHGVLAQNLSGSTLTATISQSFEANSNYQLSDPSPGTSYFGDTRLRLGLISETPTQVLNFGFDTGLRALWQAGEDFDVTFASPATASVGYGQEWASGSLDASAAYTQSNIDIDGLDVTYDEEGIPVTIEPLSGDTTRRSYSGAFALSLATDAPSSYTLSASATRIDYSGDDSDAYSGSTSGSGAATWRLQVTPLLSTAVTASYYLYDDDSAEDSDLTVAEIDAGLIFQPNQYLQYGAGLGYAHRQREETIDGERVRTQDERGLTARASLSYDFEEVVVIGNARVSTAAPSTRLSGDLRAEYPLPRGGLNARLFQTYTGDSGGDEVRVTGAGFGVSRLLTPVARLGLDFAVARQQNQDDPDEPDIDRFDAAATFSYDLTQALTANVGYRFRYLDDDPDTADSHAVFFSIGRTFVTQR